MSSDTSYDQEGQFFPIFFLTISALVVVPVTVSVLRKGKELENTASRIESDYRPEHADLIDEQLRRQKKRERKFKRAVLAVCGWIFIALNAYWIHTTQRVTAKIWDPYEILNIGTGSTEKQIRSRYRKLSVTLHPDKARPDPERNITEEFINERWVEIIKAFKALTDEDVRRNFELYGHPDGKQSTTFGIALPQFLIAEGNGKYVLLVYGALLGIVLPYFVGSWWYGSQKVTKEGTLISSVGKLFKEYRDRLDRRGILQVLSVGDEHSEALKSSRATNGLDQIEKRITASGQNSRPLSGMSSQDQAKLSEYDGTRRKAFALLWAYLGRTDLGDSTLESEKIEVAAKALGLNETFTAIAKEFGIADPLRASYSLSQNIIQALPPDASPLLQLPHFTNDAIAKIQDAVKSSTPKHLTVQDFMAVPDKQRREIALAAGIASPHYDMAIKVASQLPHLVVERAFFKVTGEKHVVPNSLFQFIIKARFIPPGATNVPPVNPADLEANDEDEDEQVNLKSGAKTSAEAGLYQPRLAHAPFFPRNHAPRWHLYLSWLPGLQVPQQYPSQLQYKNVVVPVTYSTFDKPIFTADGEPTYAVQTLKVHSMAPGNTGQVRFQSHLICDSYVGFDDHRTAVMEIEDPVKDPDGDSEDEISEPDEDTIAGQMAALRGDAATAPRRKGKAKSVVPTIEDDDDSETDDDVEDDDSETDTETESEDET